MKFEIAFKFLVEADDAETAKRLALYHVKGFSQQVSGEPLVVSAGIDWRKLPAIVGQDA